MCICTGIASSPAVSAPSEQAQNHVDLVRIMTFICIYVYYITATHIQIYAILYIRCCVCYIVVIYKRITHLYILIYCIIYVIPFVYIHI